jgi:hypothetical protein
MAKQIQTVTLNLEERDKLMLLKLCSSMGTTMSGVLRQLIHEKMEGNVMPITIHEPKPKKKGKVYRKGTVGYYMHCSMEELF